MFWLAERLDSFSVEFIKHGILVAAFCGLCSWLAERNTFKSYLQENTQLILQICLVHGC